MPPVQSDSDFAPQSPEAARLGCGSSPVSYDCGASPQSAIANRQSPIEPEPLSDYQHATAQARHQLALRWEDLKARFDAEGHPLSKRQASRLLRVPITTLGKALALWLPNRQYKDLIPPAPTGCKAPWSAFAERPEVRARLQELYLLSCGASSDYMTLGRRTGSAASTLAVFARDPLCPSDLAAALDRGSQPAALLRVIREINDLHEQRSRGPKHSSLNGTLIMRRTLVEVLGDGVAQPIAPGDWWVFDDMSDNLPHWWTNPDGLPYLGRQGLYAYDVTRRWIGVEKLGTVRDAYTAAIILRFIRKLMLAYGKPRRGVVFERSVWEARTIKGCRITPRGQLEEIAESRPSMNELEKGELQRGLSALGIIIHYTHTPRGKEIEGAFNHLQRLKPMIAAQWRARNNSRFTLHASSSVNIGRHAGEYEHAAKQLRRVHARSHHPEDLGFLHMEDSLSIDLETMAFIDRKAGEYPALAPLRETEHDVFLPEKRELTIRDGRVTATVDTYPLDFTAPELFASLGTGYRLVVAFDPSDPALGAALYNAETSSANWPGWKHGEYIGHAEFLAPVARFDWREGDVPDPQADLRRRFNKQVRTAFGAVCRPQARISQVRDGRGNVATLENGKTGKRENGMGNSESFDSSSRLPVFPSSAPPRRHPLAAPTEDEFERHSARIAEDAALARDSG